MFKPDQKVVFVGESHKGNDSCLPKHNEIVTIAGYSDKNDTCPKQHTKKHGCLWDIKEYRIAKNGNYQAFFTDELRALDEVLDAVDISEVMQEPCLS